MKRVIIHEQLNQLAKWCKEELENGSRLKANRIYKVLKKLVDKNYTEGFKYVKKYGYENCKYSKYRAEGVTPPRPNYDDD